MERTQKNTRRPVTFIVESVGKMSNNDPNLEQNHRPQHLLVAILDMTIMWQVHVIQDMHTIHARQENQCLFSPKKSFP